MMLSIHFAFAPAPERSIPPSLSPATNCPALTPKQAALGLPLHDDHAIALTVKRQACRLSRLEITSSTLITVFDGRLAMHEVLLL
jgi:hypothetical protein